MRERRARLSRTATKNGNIWLRSRIQRVQSLFITGSKDSAGTTGLGNMRCKHDAGMDVHISRLPAPVFHNKVVTCLEVTDAEIPLHLCRFDKRTSKTKKKGDLLKATQYNFFLHFNKQFKKEFRCLFVGFCPLFLKADF